MVAVCGVCKNSSKEAKLLHKFPYKDQESETEVDSWNSWDNSFVNKKPSTVQEHIEFYRQQKAQIQTQEDSEPQTDFFEDMTPRITAQKKVLISHNEKCIETSNKLSLDPQLVLMGNELGEWEENSGWDGEKLESEAMAVLKEKKRIDRERKLLEQQQRRMERSTSIKILGILSSV
ncbi:hypothetical protein Trydic_g1223 [Trypoxylus dichotomus]